jgi:hypothetical protein
MDHPALKSPFFYPDNYDENLTRFNPDGYGVDTERRIIIYMRRWQDIDSHWGRIFYMKG